MKDIYKIAEALTNETFEGISHLDICIGMQGIDPIIGNRAPTFFMQSFFAHLYAAQMYASKLFDTHQNAMTIPRFLQHCCKRKNEFKHAREAEVLAYVYEAGTIIMGMDDTIEILERRRNNYLAHISHRLVFNRQLLTEGPQLKFEQIRELLLKGGRIVNQLSSMWCGTSNQILDSHTDDYKVVVEMMHKQMMLEADEQEAEARTHNYDLKVPRPKRIAPNPGR